MENKNNYGPVPFKDFKQKIHNYITRNKINQHGLPKGFLNINSIKLSYDRRFGIFLSEKERESENLCKEIEDGELI